LRKLRTADWAQGAIRHSRQSRRSWAPWSDLRARRGERPLHSL